jgi:hypothetical protein
MKSFRALTLFASLTLLLIVVCATNGVNQSALAQAASGVKVEEKVAYNGLNTNIRISNGTVEMMIATEYGPRIMRFAPAGSEDSDNLFGTLDAVNVKTDQGQWNIRGGHRLWHAPEGMPRSYVPDNAPIQVVRDGDTVKLIQAVENATNIQKEIWVTLDAAGSHVTVLHKLTNKGLFPIEMACWAMSVMNKGGIAIMPQEPYQSHDDALQPTRPMVLWSYTNLTDPRWMFGQKYVTLRQDPDVKEAQKIGILNRQGWAAYFRKSMLFLKRFGYDNDKRYPDYNCNNEAYTDANFLELETLGPLEKVEPGASITHREDWWLYKGVDIGNGEAGIAAALQPILSDTAKQK